MPLNKEREGRTSVQDEYAALIRKLKAIREDKDIKQIELGKMVGISQSHICKIEGGGIDIHASTLLLIARVLGMEVSLIPAEDIGKTPKSDGNARQRKNKRKSKRKNNAG